ncbi:MAG: VIT domain-containing protein [Pseudomonadota bacterium]
MRRKRLIFGFMLLMLAYGGTSCEKVSISGYTVGLVKFVRPDVTVLQGGKKAAIFEDTRFLPDSEIEISKGARSTILFDSGVKVMADGGTRIKVNEVDDIAVLAGRIFIDADEKEQMNVAAGKGKLMVIGSGVSLQVEGEGKVKTYTYRGELTYNFPGGNGVVRAGESLTVQGENFDIQPEELWEDWTGGMAEAGPRPMESPVSIGQIYARLPGSSGMGRSPLIIRRHEVRVTIEGDLAVTETMQQFFNPSSYVMEGIYRLSIPSDSIMQRFAVDRNGRLVDGYIKERKAAKQEYDSHVYQGSTSDPALLEWVAPGSFKARIYPIKPGEVRTVAYRYSQWLKPSGEDGKTRTYVYPIGNETIAPQIGEFYLVADVSDAGTQVVQAGAGARIEKGRVVFAQSDFRPRSDFYIQLMDVQSELEEDEIMMVKTDYRGVLGQIAGKRSEVYARTQFVLRDKVVDIKPEKSLRISIAMDMSAATEQQMVDLAVTFLDSIFEQLGEEDEIAVFTGDIDAKIVGKKELKLARATGAFKESVIDSVSRHSIGGATDIGKLIMEAAAVSANKPGGAVVYIGDGFPTVGELDLGSLKERIKRLPNPVRLYGIALGDEANLDLLTGLCSGRGLAGRIENRVEAAEKATQVLADASTPVIENISYEIDGGIERVYPAEISTLKITEPAAFIGRLTGEKDPEKITVKGTIKGKPFKKEYKIVMEEIRDYGDLRLRWAEQRLLGLLAEQEGPEAVIELGTRYGIITPFTSFYVPPAEEALNYPERQPFEVYHYIQGSHSSNAYGNDDGITLAQAVFGLFMPYGCSLARKAMQGGKEDEQVYYTTDKPQPVTAPPPRVESTVTASEEMEAPEELKKAEAERFASATAEEGGYAYGAPAADSARDYKESMPEKKSKAGKSTSYDKDRGLLDLIASGGSAGDMADPSAAYDEEASGHLTVSSGPQGAQVILDGSGSMGGDDLMAQLSKQGYESTTKTKITFQQETHISTNVPVNLTDKVKQCTEASLTPIDEKTQLWTERLGSSPSMSHVASVFQQAKKSCEIKSATDRRAFARLVLRLLGSVYSKCQFYSNMKQYPALARYIKTKILASLTTPEAVKTAMQQCDAAVFLSSWDVDKILDKQKNIDDKIVALKKLIALYPNDMDMKLRLLDLLEDAKRSDEAIRFADTLRQDPYATDAVRTRVGELFWRMDDKENAKRVFSEIVEFAPWSYTARRRLGDLYRTYGWYEDAYRQYETLSKMAPNDNGVLILLAEAAILAGRSDEGLRIMEQVSQSEPSYEGKITPAEIARVIASLELIKMRVKARDDKDDKKLKALENRTRRVGVLRDAAQMKIILKWDHPDAGFNLTIKYPGSELTRPFRSAPSMGLEWITEKKMPDEDVLLQVRRTSNVVIKESRAVMIIIMNEGEDNETVREMKIELTDMKKGTMAWKLAPDGTLTETRIDKGEPL